MASPSKIKVTRTHNRYFVWTSSDVIRLRKEWRIIGVLIGFQSQVGEEVLPLQLSSLETRLLLEEGAIDIYEVIDNPSEEAIKSAQQSYQEYQNKAKEKVKTVLIEEKKKIIQENADNVISKHRQRNVSEGKSDEEILQSVLKRVEGEVSGGGPPPVETFPDSPFPQFLKRVEVNPDDLKSADPQQEFKYLVFRDLWKKGYFLTRGDNFSCDFLAYQYDPMVCHSTYMVVCKSGEHPSLSSLEMSVKGRLSTQVNKELLLAYQSKNREDISYMHLDWEGKRGK